MSSLHVYSNQKLSTERSRPAELTLDENGMILDCSDSAEGLFKYSRNELIEQPVSKLLPQLSEIKLVKDGKPNPQLGFLCRCGHRFLTRGQYGTFSSELNFVFLAYGGMSILRLIVHPYGNAGF